MVARRINVRMNDHPVGQLTLSAAGILSFGYAAEWLRSPVSRPISLTMPLSTRPYAGEDVRQFLQNLLPDNQTVISRIQRELVVPSAHPFDLLGALGRDCAGALQFSPAYSDSAVPTEATLLTDADISHFLQEAHTAPLGMTTENGLRFTIAGAQRKTALFCCRGRWFIPRGASATSHILKLPIGTLPGNPPVDFSLSCENEWLCLLASRLYGFSTAAAELRRFGTETVLIVERFDRQTADDKISQLRLPTEDCCQALGVPAVFKYESDGGPGISAIMNLLQYSSRTAADRETFFKTQILFWLLQATDGHAKNFSVFLEKGGGFHLTPLYDIMSTAPLTATGAVSPRRIKMAMGLLGKNKHYRFFDIEPRHFLSTAAAVGLPMETAKAWLRELADKTPSVIEVATRELPPDFPTNVSEPIFTGMTARSEKIRRFLVTQ